MSICTFSKRDASSSISWEQVKYGYVKAGNGKKAIQVFVKINGVGKPVGKYSYMSWYMCSLQCGGGYVMEPSITCIKDDGVHSMKVDSEDCEKYGVTKPADRIGEVCNNWQCSATDVKYLVSTDGNAYFYESDPNMTIGRLVLYQEINYSTVRNIGRINRRDPIGWVFVFCGKFNRF